MNSKMGDTVLVRIAILTPAGNNFPCSKHRVRQFKSGPHLIHKEESNMELYTLASAAERIGCTPNRLKVWIDKGYVPEMRIQMGKVRARVVDEESIEKIKRVLEAMERKV
jgi:hypothetical protein